MNVIKTIFRIKPRINGSSKKSKSFDSFKNEFYIASNEFSKQKLISFYGIEDCAITSGHGSCLKLESIFGASTISRGSSRTLAASASSSSSLDPISESIEDIKRSINENKKNKFSKISNKNIDEELNIAIGDTINELKLKLQERKNKNKTSNETINDDEIKKIESNLENSLASSDTIYNQSVKADKINSEDKVKDTTTPEDTKQSPSSSIDYLTSNPDVVIDMNKLTPENTTLPCLNKSNSSVQINNINIHEEENKAETVPKNEITIDIDNATKITTVTNENEKDQQEQQEQQEKEKEKEMEKEKNVRFVNKLYAKKLEEMNKNPIEDMEFNTPRASSNYHQALDRKISFSDNDVKININDSFLSEDSLNSKLVFSPSTSRKVHRSYDYLNKMSNRPYYRNRLYNSTGSSMDKKGLFDNQVFLNKLIDRYSPQQRLSVSFNHLYDPLFVSNNLSKRYDMELKYVDLSVKDIYEHGLPYLLRSKRPLIEFCKELIKECQIEVLFFINDVCDFQKQLYVKPSDILKHGKEIYSKYLNDDAICPLEISQSLKLQCVRDLKILKKECFHAISLYFYKNLDFIFEEFKSFVLKEHYDNKTEFDTVLITQKSEEEKKKFEDDLIKLVEIYYKSSDEALTAKQQFIIERTKELCQSLLN